MSLYTSFTMMSISFNVELVLKMKANSYTLATGGSNDSYLTKNELFDRKNS
jgi:hypothetical protein